MCTRPQAHPGTPAGSAAVPPAGAGVRRSPRHGPRHRCPPGSHRPPPPLLVSTHLPPTGARGQTRPRAPGRRPAAGAGLPRQVPARGELRMGTALRSRARRCTAGLRQGGFPRGGPGRVRPAAATARPPAPGGPFSCLSGSLASSPAVHPFPLASSKHTRRIRHAKSLSHALRTAQKYLPLTCKSSTCQ